MSRLEDHYNENIYPNAVPTLIGAKRAASTRENVWKLPNGKYIAVAPGICIPPGSELASEQIVPNEWRDR